MITAESGSFKEDYPDHGSHFLEHTPTLEVKESFPEEMDEIITTEGHNTIISVTDPEHGWVDRKALAYSIDFQCYDESDPRIRDDTIEIFIPHGAWLAPQKVVTEEGSVWIWKLVGWKDEVYCDSKGHQENIEGEIRINLQANTAENLIEEIQEENHA